MATGKSGEYEIVVNNEDVDLRIFVSRDNPGFKPLHWHRHIEIVLVLSGTVTFSYEAQNVVLHSGEFIVVGSGVLHSSHHEKNCSVVLQVPISYLDRYWSHAENMLFTIQSQDIPTPEYQEIVATLQQIVHVYRYKLKGYQFKFHELMLHCLYLIFTHYGQDSLPINVVQDQRLKTVLSDINERYTTTLTVNDLAHKFHYNPDYLSRIFKQKTGVSLSRYIYLVRLSHVHFEIVNSDKGIHNIFVDNGIHNIRLGTKLFEQYYGALPREIRKQRR
ncbi:helix-turn-helix domain-containing protein [Weissella kandleri]|uniref:AraC family transcriptional regulator n=1 Tax=Weissella kandleri TaxID=1616 RepID=UPI00387ECEB0